MMVGIPRKIFCLWKEAGSEPYHCRREKEVQSPPAAAISVTAVFSCCVCLWQLKCWTIWFFRIPCNLALSVLWEIVPCDSKVPIYGVVAHFLHELLLWPCRLPASICWGWAIFQGHCIGHDLMQRCSVVASLQRRLPFVSLHESLLWSSPAVRKHTWKCDTCRPMVGGILWWQVSRSVHSTL